MKKLTSILLALVLALTMLSPLAALADEDVIRVAIVQLAENGAFADMRNGFIARLRELGYTEDKMIIDEYNANSDMSNLYAICSKIVDDEYDAVATIATPPAQAMVNTESGIPVFFISVSDPVAAGIVSAMDTPDRNATGTSNAIPSDEMFKLADQLTPGIESYGFLYCSSQVNSVTTVAAAKKYLDSIGKSYVEKTVTSSAEIYEAMNALCEEDIQGIFIPNDSMIQDGMATVSEIAIGYELPVYGSSAVMVAHGAFATISISDTQIGAITADLFAEYLNGKAVEDIPAIVVDQFTTVINKTTANAIGIELADEILADALILE